MWERVLPSSFYPGIVSLSALYFFGLDSAGWAKAMHAMNAKEFSAVSIVRAAGVSNNCCMRRTSWQVSGDAPRHLHHLWIYDLIPNIVALIISHFDGQHKIHNVIPDIICNILKCNFLTCGRNLALKRLMAGITYCSKIACNMIPETYASCSLRQKWRPQTNGFAQDAVFCII